MPTSPEPMLAFDDACRIILEQARCMESEAVPLGQALGRILAEAGYRCANIGKWHVDDEFGPEQFGFEGTHYPGWEPTLDHPEYLEYLSNNGYPGFRCRDRVFLRQPSGRRSGILAGIYDGPAEGTFDGFVAHKAAAKLEEFAEDYHRSGKPFLMFCNFFGPHLPYLLPAEFAGMYDPDSVPRPPSFDETFAGKPTVQPSYSRYWGADRFDWPAWQRLIAMYWGYVTMLDGFVGRLLAKLDELPEDESVAPQAEQLSLF